MARSGNVSFYVLQQKCCDPNKLRSRAMRVVAFFLLTDCGASTRCVRGGPGDRWQEQQSPIMKPGTPSQPQNVLYLKFLTPSGVPVRVLLPEHPGGDNRPDLWWRQAVDMEPAPPSGSGSAEKPCEALSPQGFSLAH